MGRVLDIYTSLAWETIFFTKAANTRFPQATTKLRPTTSGAAQANFQAIFTDRRGGLSGRRKYQTRLISADHLHDQEPNFIVRIW